MSGGELQRAVIARALTLNPDFLICDEPTSMLDVSTQASVIRLLLRIHEEKDVTVLFITHDLELAGVVSDRVLIMNEGKVIKELRPEELIESLKRSYRGLERTRALIRP